MGKQINYWMGYEEFLQVAQAALDNGRVIIKRGTDSKLEYGHTIDFVTEEHHRYYFYVPEAGELVPRQLPSGAERIGGYNASGNAVIEAGFSFGMTRKGLFQEADCMSSPATMTMTGCISRDRSALRRCTNA